MSEEAGPEAIVFRQAVADFGCELPAEFSEGPCLVKPIVVVVMLNNAFTGDEKFDLVLQRRD